MADFEVWVGSVRKDKFSNAVDSEDAGECEELIRSWARSHKVKPSDVELRTWVGPSLRKKKYRI